MHHPLATKVRAVHMGLRGMRGTVLPRAMAPRPISPRSSSSTQWHLCALILGGFMDLPRLLLEREKALGVLAAGALATGALVAGALAAPTLCMEDDSAMDDDGAGAAAQGAAGLGLLPSPARREGVRDGLVGHQRLRVPATGVHLEVYVRRPVPPSP